jgi:hypothetical protein
MNDNFYNALRALIAIVVFCVCITVVVLFFEKNSECQANGGVLVKTAFWYECIDRKSLK